MVVNNSATVTGEIDAVGARRGRSCCTSPPGSTTAPGWWSCAPHPTPPGPVLDAAPGETIGVGELPADAARAVPARGLLPDRLAATGSGAPASRATCGALLDRHGRPIAYGYLDRRYPLAAYQSVFAACPAAPRCPRPDDRSPTALVTELVARGVARRADHAAHRGVLAGGRRGAAAGVVRGDRRRPRGWSNAVRAGGGRVVAVGHHRHPRTRVSRRRRRRSGGPRRLDRPGGHPGRPAAGGRRADHRLARPAGLAPAAGRGGRRRRADPARRTTPRWPSGYLWHEFGDSALLLP